jgi:type VI secretion system protein ImpJ
MTVASNSGARRKGRAQVAAADVPPPIQWSEGMLLAPQHFQQQSLRHELLVHYHAAAAAPFHWGVRRLAFGPGLADGVFNVVELEAVLPDGLIVSQSKADAELTVNLKQRIDDVKNGPLTVHLAVVARGGGLAQDERYSSEDGGMVRDENTGDGELPITVLKPKLQLLLGDDVPAKYVSFPLARIAYENETFIQTPFEPPLLRVELGSPIHKLCGNIAVSLREKAILLAEEVRSPAASTLGVPQVLDRKVLIHCLVGELPAFEALLGSRVSHPFPLYLAFCSLLGHVAGLGRVLVPPALPSYDHNDVMASFEAVAVAISHFIAEGTHDVYRPHLFRIDGEEFHLKFDADWMGREAILGVRAPSGVSDQQMASWVMSSVIASRSKIVALRDSRVRGAKRREIEAVEGLVPPAGMTLYAVDPQPEHVQPGEDLVVVNPGERRLRRPASMVLYIHNRRAE